MKKLLFLFAVCVGITFASCGNKTDNTAATNDSTDTDSVAPVALNDSVDSVSTDSTDTIHFDVCGD